MKEIDGRVDRSLYGKVAIVTGAGCKGSGIGNGRAAAILLAADGCSVLCVDRQEQWANETAEMIKTEGQGGSAVCVGDVTSAEDCARIVATAVSTFGRLDILINNVGISGPPGNAVEVDIQGWTHGLEVNVTSMMIMAKYAIPEMLKNPGEVKGSIVNLGSVAGLGGGFPHLLYATSKGAVINMTKAMAADHGKSGIRVNCVCPGLLHTPMIYEFPEMTEEIREARRGANVLGTEGTGWDCGHAVRWLAGPESRWVTAVALPVDAGVTGILNVTGFRPW